MPEVKTLTLPPLGTNCYLVKTAENSGVVVDPASEAQEILDAADKFGMKIKKNTAHARSFRPHGRSERNPKKRKCARLYSRCGRTAAARLRQGARILLPVDAV